MKTILFYLGNLTVAVILLYIAYAIFSANAAEYAGKDGHNYIFNDEGVIRYCLDPGAGANIALCKTDGVQFVCKALPADQGFIGECKET